MTNDHVISSQNVPAARDALLRLQRALDENPSMPIAAILPLIFKLKDKPFSLVDHFPQEPLYRLLRPPQRLVTKAGRQVAKSTNLAVVGLLRAMLCPHYNLLTVTPLFEQVRRFSSNYVKPMLADCTVRTRITRPGTDNSVLQRTLANGAILHYNYASNSADRIRGIPADEMNCLRRGTMVLCADGTKIPVEQLRAGDRLASLDVNGYTTDEVVDIIDHGVRPLWRVTLDDGSFVEVTDNEVIATDSGWRYLADLHPATAHSWHLAGRRLPVEDRASSEVSRGPRGAAGSLSPAQGRSTAESAWDATEVQAQSRVRRDVVGVYDAADRAARPNLGSLLFAGQEAGDTGVARPSGSTGLDLPVAGRWLGRGRQPCISQRGILPSGESADCELVDRQGLRRFGVSSQGAVLVCTALPRRRASYDRADQAVHSRHHGLQARPASGITDDSLRLLWSELPSEGKPGERNNLSRSMPGPRLLTLAGSATQRTVYDAAEEVGEGRSEQAAVCTGGSSVHREVSSCCPAATGEPRVEGADERSSQGMATGPQGPRTLCPVDIRSIEYIGEDRVFDVVLSTNHVFFAGKSNIVVHNCDEAQDMDSAVLDIIEQCLAASPWALKRYSGTPKTFDGPLQQLWDLSSQAVWHTPCFATGCKKINRMSVDGDLIKMVVGNPRLQCAACGAAVDPRHGYYVHDRPERQVTFPGYLMGQTQFPMHYASPSKWQTIQTTIREKPAYVWHNEIFGESFDAGQKLLTREDLVKAAHLPIQHPRAFKPTDYIETALGVDWGGKGRERTTDKTEMISNTALALAGMRGDGRIEVRYVRRVPYEADPAQEATLVRQTMVESRARWLAHDYGGAGNLREAFMTQAGFPAARIVPFTYARMSLNKPIVFYQGRGATGVRTSYILDKSRSLLLLCEMIKLGLVLLPQWDIVSKELSDFLNMFEESMDGPRGSARQLVKRIAKTTDDTAHAVNFAVMALLHSTGRWPDIAKAYNEPIAGDPETWTDADQ